MRDLARHKILLGLASSIIENSSREGVLLPKHRNEAIEDPNFSMIDTYSPRIPVTGYLKETLGECLSMISDNDYTVLKAHIHAIQHDSVDLSTADNIAFSGGGGKGIGYSGLIKHLSSETNYSFIGEEVLRYISLNFPDSKIPRDSAFFYTGKLSQQDFVSEIKEIFTNQMHASHALHMMGQDGVIQERPVLSTIKAVSGTSAGAITALPVALGMDYDDYAKLLIHSQFNHFFLSSSDITSRAARIIKTPELYRNKYVKRFSQIYLEELTLRAGEIMPNELNMSDSDEKEVLISSLLRDATPYGIDHLYHRAKKAGMLSQIKQSTEDRINKEIEGNSPGCIRKFFVSRATRFTNTLEQAKEDFIKSGGFKSKDSSYGYKTSEDEAFFVSVYQQSKSDNISMFFGRLISNRLKEISFPSLVKACPGKYEDAFIVNPKNALLLINEASRHLHEAGQLITDESIYKTCHKMCTLRKRELYKYGMPIDLSVENTLVALNLDIKKATRGEREILDNAFDIIDSLYTDKRRSHSLIQYAKSHQQQNNNNENNILSNLASVQRACKRSFYNNLGSLTFSELKRLQHYAPDEGFKDLYITATKSRFFSQLKLPSTTYFSHKNDSNVPIQNAIRASMTLPFLFKKTQHDNFNLFDGGIFENIPSQPFKNQKSTIVAMVEDENFYKNGDTYLKSWKNNIFSKAFYWMNENMRTFSLSESMRSIFSSSHHYATTNFSFMENDLENISAANRDIFDDDKGFTKDAMFYFLQHKEIAEGKKSVGHNDDNDFEKGLHKGIFSPGKDSKDSYGEHMLKLAERHITEVQSYDI